MSQHCIHFISTFRFLFFIHNNFTDNFFDKVVFLIDDIFFITAVQYMRQIHRISRHNIGILFQKFNRMPAVIFNLRILFFQFIGYQVNFVFNQVAVYHSIFGMMIMFMFALFLNIIMIMYQQYIFIIFFMMMMGNCMHQYIQTPFFASRHRHYWNAQHFRQTMHVYFHTAFFHNIHHIQGQNDWFTQFNQLQRQIQIAFQRGRIRDINNNIRIIA